MASEMNGHIANGGVQGGPLTTQMPECMRGKNTIIQTVFELIVFVIASLGYIIQALYWSMFGHPKKDLRGGIAVVTGGGGGLGSLIALRLSRLGCKVVLWDINKQGLEDTVKLVNAVGGNCHGYLVDLTRREDVYRAARLVREEVGRVTMLINNAGVVSGKMFLDTPDELIIRTFDVNVLAHFWTVKAFLPGMLEARRGHVVTIASLAGHVGIPKLVDYCASKAAACGFDEALRCELEAMGEGARGVHTTLVCPYFIQSTGMFDDVNSRFVPKLNSNAVADRIISAIRADEKFAIVPGYLQLMLPAKWLFPWGCVSGFLRGLVPDAVPDDSGDKSANKVSHDKHDDVFVDKSASEVTIHRRPIPDGERKP